MNRIQNHIAVIPFTNLQYSYMETSLTDIMRQVSARETDELLCYIRES
jgi:hypothetical protein